MIPHDSSGSTRMGEQQMDSHIGERTIKVSVVTDGVLFGYVYLEAMLCRFLEGSTCSPLGLLRDSNSNLSIELMTALVNQLNTKSVDN